MGSGGFRRQGPQAIHDPVEIGEKGRPEAADGAGVVFPGNLLQAEGFLPQNLSRDARPVGGGVR